MSSSAVSGPGREHQRLEKEKNNAEVTLRAVIWVIFIEFKGQAIAITWLLRKQYLGHDESYTTSETTLHRWHKMR
jgi:hypothetical protein